MFPRGGEIGCFSLLLPINFPIYLFVCPALHKAESFSLPEIATKTFILKRIGGCTISGFLRHPGVFRVEQVNSKDSSSRSRCAHTLTRWRM